MHFLCAKHRQSLISLPEFEISSYWLDWMLQAGQHYEDNNWHKAKLFAGGAMDLASSALLRKDINHDNMAIQATLAAIYTINCFQQVFEQAHSDKALALLTERLTYVMNHTNGQEWGLSCLAALENKITQADFFQSYMTLPLVAPKSDHRSNVYYSNNVVSLH